MGSRRAALAAGQRPKVRPTTTEVTKATTTQVGWRTAGNGEKRVDQAGGHAADDDAEDAARAGQGHGLGQELPEDVALAWPRGPCARRSRACAR